MNKLKFRHELKYEINAGDYLSLQQRVCVIARADPNAVKDGKYHIRSLYFDNENDHALRQKMEGLPNREKYRIRIYNGERDNIRLEKKSKRYGLCNKQTTCLSVQECKKILIGNVDWMVHSDDPVILDFYAKVKVQLLKPRVIVDYWREAYAYPFGNIRITFDSDIRTGLYATDLFSENHSMIKVCNATAMLLEIKYDNFLPDVIRDIVQTPSRSNMAFSKYAASRVYG